MERQWKNLEDYTNEQTIKHDFVSTKLTPLLRAARLDIADAIYQVDTYNSEFVVVKFKHNYSVQADVTSDSLLTLCADVIKQLCY